MHLNNIRALSPAKTELERTREYVSVNIVKANEGRKCVDGRYQPNQATGMIARPGGDCGYVMALLAVNKRKSLGMTPEQCFNSVYKVVSRGKNGHFCMHTDHHCDPNAHTHKGLIGCGHIAKAAVDSLSHEYEVDSKDVERFINYARNIADIMPTMDMVNLSGEHQEVGVLVIDDKNYTVNADDPDSKRMYFIYDRLRDSEYLKYLTAEMALPEVNFAEMKRESDQQLTATLHNLAIGLPVYNVTFNSKISNVVFSAYVR